MRGGIAPWAEKAAERANSMTTVCTIVGKQCKARDAALARISLLQEEVKALLIVEVVEMKICVIVPWLTVDGTVNTVVNNVVTSVTATILDQLGAKQAFRS